MALDILAPVVERLIFPEPIGAGKAAARLAIVAFERSGDHGETVVFQRQPGKCLASLGQQLTRAD